MINDAYDVWNISEIIVPQMFKDGFQNWFPFFKMFLKGFKV